MAKKETVFDHNLTEEEFRYLFGTQIEIFGEAWIKENFMKKTQDEHYEYIASLYRFRGDGVKMNEYLDKIQDPLLRADAGRTLWTDFTQK